MAGGAQRARRNDNNRPKRQATTLEALTRRNRAGVLSLTLPESQRGFVESPALCLREAKRLWRWRPAAICVRDRVVGFAMYGKFPREGRRGRVWLDRLLIGAQYQGKGYGRYALGLLCELLRKTYGCRELYLSCYPQNRAAITLYKKAGFRFNGEKDIHGEDVMVRRWR